MLGNIIAAIVIGIIAGYLGRLLLPGKDPMGFVGTVVAGIIGALVGYFLFTADRHRRHRQVRLRRHHRRHHRHDDRAAHLARDLQPHERRHARPPAPASSCDAAAAGGSHRPPSRRAHALARLGEAHPLVGDQRHEHATSSASVTSASTSVATGDQRHGDDRRGSRCQLKRCTLRQRNATCASR